MKQPAVTSCDWAAMIDDLICRGISARAIGDAMECMLTDRMINHYRRGVQPLHWRGELLVAFWCAVTKSQRDTAPQCEVVRGHRVAQNHHDCDSGPRLQSLPRWTVAIPLAVKPLRKKPGPKPRVRTAEVV